MFIGLDIGTTSTKAFLYDPEGVIYGKGEAGYSLSVPLPGRAEQQPTDIIHAIITALKLAMENAGAHAGQIEAVGVSTAMHSLMAVDQEGKAITPLMTWADNRSVKQVQALRREGTAKILYEMTGTPNHPMSPLTKLIWMREEAQDLFKKAYRFISIKEYIIFQLFGSFTVDVSVASATGLYDIKQMKWSIEAMETAGIRPDQLGEVVPVTTILRGLKSEYATACGLSQDTPWVIGASDGALANVGVGATISGQTAVTIGTSGAIRSFANRPLLDPKGKTFCYAFSEERWLIGGPTNNGGIALQWFLDQFGIDHGQAAVLEGKDAIQALIDMASTITPGAEGLLFLPYLSGERAPYWNADARGTFFGVSLHHGKPHFARAVIEGVLFALHGVEEALVDMNGRSEVLMASGGFARSSIWTQMLADVSGTRVIVPDTYEASAFGAAVIAMVAMGTLPNIDAVTDKINMLRTHEPNRLHTEQYQEMYQLYKAIYASLEPSFTVMAEYQRKQALDRLN